MTGKQYKSMKPKRPIEEYINFDPFDGDKESGKIECKRVKVVKILKEQWCCESDHNIPKGSWSRFESAKYDGEWSKWYHCCDCIDKYLDEWE